MEPRSTCSSNIWISPTIRARPTVLAQGLLICGLVVERRTRRRAQTNLADAEQRYRTVADYAADWEYWRQPDGSLRYVSPSSEAITGYTPAAFMARPELLTEIVVEADRERWAAHMQAVQSSDTPPPPRHPVSDPDPQR